MFCKDFANYFFSFRLLHESTILVMCCAMPKYRIYSRRSWPAFKTNWKYLTKNGLNLQKKIVFKVMALWFYVEKSKNVPMLVFFAEKWPKFLKLYTSIYGIPNIKKFISTDLWVCGLIYECISYFNSKLIKKFFGIVLKDKNGLNVSLLYSYKVFRDNLKIWRSITQFSDI